MKLDDFINGINILRPYFKDPNGFHIAAEHDQFYVYATDFALSDKDVKKLDELGWFQPETEEDDPYNPNEGWSAYT